MGESKGSLKSFVAKPGLQGQRDEFPNTMERQKN